MDLKVNQLDKFIAGPPKDSVSGVIATEADTEAAVQALVDAGFSMGQEGILIFQGEEGARQIDVRGEQHGFLAKLLRTAQALTNELDHVQNLEKELLAGRYLLLVHASTPEARLQAKDILEAHNGSFVTTYGKLGPGSGSW